MTIFQPLPTLDVENGIFRAWWFDPLLATAAFTFFIHWYWYHEKQLGLSQIKTINWKTFNPFSMQGYSIIGYWTGIYLWRLLVPPASTTLPDGIPSVSSLWDNPSEWLYLGMEVVSGIVLYDAIFFFIHMAMHEIPFLRPIHRKHHTNTRSLESRDVLRHSLLDATLQIMVNILVQRHTPWGAVKSRFARALHNIFVIWFLTESHTAAPTPNIWRRFFVGIREHRRHHLLSVGIDSHKGSSSCHGGGGGQHNHRYQQFFGYLDNLRFAWSSNGRKYRQRSQA